MLRKTFSDQREGGSLGRAKKMRLVLIKNHQILALDLDSRDCLRGIKTKFMRGKEK